MLVKLSDSANVGKRWCFRSVFINIYVVVKKVEQCFVGGGAISPSLSVNCIGLLFIFPSFWPFFFLNFKRFSNIREIKLLSLIQVANVFLSSFGHLSFDFIYMWFAMHLSYFYVDEFISLGLPLNFES